VKANREWLDSKVIANSAVLLRGFDVRDAVECSTPSWRRWDGPTSGTSARSAPRTYVHGRVWTANDEGPLEQFVYFHHEMVLVRVITLYFCFNSFATENVHRTSSFGIYGFTPR
jgi:hypothetical protein